MHNIPSILHLKLTFFILHTHFYKTPTSAIYSTYLFNKIFIFLQFFITLPHRPSLSQTNTPSQTQTQTQHSLTNLDPTHKEKQQFLLTCELCCIVGIRFRQSDDQNGSLLGSVFLFGSSTQT